MAVVSVREVAYGVRQVDVSHVAGARRPRQGCVCLALFGADGPFDTPAPSTIINRGSQTWLEGMAADESLPGRTVYGVGSC